MHHRIVKLFVVLLALLLVAAIVLFGLLMA
jgi:hypothetical protein